jgi:predicted molibdopterin-dependent oxidoreductase YjgC
MRYLGVSNIDFMRHIDPAFQDDLLRRADTTPNSLGAKEVGIHPYESGLDFDGIIRAVREGKIKVLYCLEDNIAKDPAVADALARLEFLVVHSSNENMTTDLADVVFSASSFAARHGTYTNFEGQVQRIRPAVAAVDQDRALDGFTMSRWDKFGAHNDRWAKGVKLDARPTWRILTSLAAVMGARWKYTMAEDVFNEIASNIEAFKGLTYLKLGSQGARITLKSKPGQQVPQKA